MHRNRILIVVSICAFIALTAVVLWPQPKQAAASHVAAISAGSLHTCSLTTSGGVQCWGRNDSGQLGNGTTGDSAIPVDVVGLETGVVAIASGMTHTCALTTEGGVQCWGRIQSSSSTTPVLVVGLETGVSAIAGGFHNACALTTSGGVKCWGAGFLGELGNGTTTSSEVAVDVLEEPDGAPLSGAVAIAAGGYSHNCVLTAVGGVKCWGSNGFGQLGSATTDLCGGGPCSTVPVDVVGLDSAVAAVGAGAAHTCVLTETGGAKCWGHNPFGGLGNGEAGYGATTPQDVLGLGTGVAAISPGGLHTCALLIAGGVQCWGYNFFGQVGDGTAGPGEEERLTPVDVLGLSRGVVAISAGDLHSCALTDTGAVTCWGAADPGNFGQTGDSDGDGCTDFAEHGTTAVLGGRRDHLDYWDFFDTPNASNYRDRRIDITDIAAVVARFGAVGDSEGDPLSPPPPAPAYHTAFDRGGPMPGQNLWNLLPADGAINIVDIGAAIIQFGHTCA